MRAGVWYNAGMRAALSSLLITTLTAGGCYLENPRHRTIAKVSEGTVALGGIALLAVVNSGADCMTDIPGMPDQDCESRAALLGNLGLGLLLAGLAGFIVTVSTSPEDDPDQPAATTPAATVTPPTPATLPAAPPPVLPTEPVPPTTPGEPPPTPPGETPPTPPGQTPPAPPPGS